MEALAGGAGGCGTPERQPGPFRARDVQAASGDGDSAPPSPADHKKVVGMLREMLGGGGVAPCPYSTCFRSCLVLSPSPDVLSSATGPARHVAVGTSRVAASVCAVMLRGACERAQAPPDR
ncbi:hypothetical protein T484DRAFT_1831059 [Baffinella frigidus]|nr:hypothetical protein T484DRAFT_1831059 [Cryptophyta sp. CCMP2293]